jgi:hypothetical protein
MGNKWWNNWGRSVCPRFFLVMKQVASMSVRYIQLVLSLLANQRGATNAN